jgi:hypothetical protein
MNRRPIPRPFSGPHSSPIVQRRGVDLPAKQTYSQLYTGEKEKYALPTFPQRLDLVEAAYVFFHACIPLRQLRYALASSCTADLATKTTLSPPCVSATFDARWCRSPTPQAASGSWGGAARQREGWENHAARLPMWQPGNDQKVGEAIDGEGSSRLGRLEEKL